MKTVRHYTDDYSVNQYIEGERITWERRVNPHQPEAGLCASTTASVRNFTVQIKLYVERAVLITTEWSLCIDFTVTRPLYKPLLAHYGRLVSVGLAVTWHIYQKDLGGGCRRPPSLVALLKFWDPGVHPAAGCSAQRQSRGERGRAGGEGVNLQDSAHHASVR